MEGKKISKHLLDDSLQREIENKSDEGHRHTESDIIDLDKYTKEEVDNLLDGKANTDHTHTEDDIVDLDKYTKAETDDLLQNKANKIHTHTESDIEDLDKYSRQEVDDLLSEKLDKTGNLSWEQITDKPKLAHDSWRSPVATFEDLPKTGNRHEDVRMVLDGEYANHVFSWNVHTEEWELIGANDTNIEWDNIQAKPSTFPPEPHEHTESDIVDLDKYTQSEVDDLLNEKSDKNHTHDELHTHSNKNVLDNITQTGTETTFDLSSFETKGHQHSEDDIIDLDKYTKAEVDNLLDGKSDEGHTHPELHEHDNKSVLDKVIETEEYETYDISQISILDQRMADIESGYSEGHTHHNLDILDQIDYTGPETTVDLIKMEENEHQINQLKQNKADQSELNAHKENRTIHVTQTDKDNWNNKSEFSGRYEDLENIPNEFPPENHTHDYEDLTNKPSLDGFVRKDGDTMTSDLVMDGASVNYQRPDTTGGWARGFWWSHRDMSRIGGIGVYGNADVPQYFYIGYGESPWLSPALAVYPDKLEVNGNEVYHEGNFEPPETAPSVEVSAETPTNGAETWYRIIG